MWVRTYHSNEDKRHLINLEHYAQIHLNQTADPNLCHIVASVAGDTTRHLADTTPEHARKIMNALSAALMDNRGFIDLNTIS
ncbi:MAG TPA: hypothetical protein VFB38_15580 [Chthonomonadaceae bacterium]|jgi:hypothetical protein|nr:hypothetical protein [Chthonomonadaceae bacterium]